MIAWAPKAWLTLSASESEGRNQQKPETGFEKVYKTAVFSHWRSVVHAKQKVRI